jgi:hypothetical protein
MPPKANKAPTKPTPKVRSLGQVLELPNEVTTSNPLVISWDGKSAHVSILDKEGRNDMEPEDLPSISKESAQVLIDVLTTFVKHGVLDLG